MQHDDRDAGYLWDMLEAAKNAQEFTSVKSIVALLCKPLKKG